MEPYADSFHIDVMDDHFAPGLLFFPDLVSSLRPLSKRPFHVHLIAEQPSRLIEAFTAAGCDLFTMQLEAGANELGQCFDHCREFGREAGIALRLDTPVDGVEDFLEDVVAIVLMGTQSGIKGAELAPQAYDRVTALSELLTAHGRRDKIRIVADGGIRRQYGAAVAKGGSQRRRARLPCLRRNGRERSVRLAAPTLGTFRRKVHHRAAWVSKPEWYFGPSDVMKIFRTLRPS